MNERIRELAGQAKVQYCDLSDASCFKRLGLVEAVVFKPEDLEKFAELIVGECIEKITTYDLVPGHSAKWEDIYDIHTRLLQDLGEELKEHFGVTK